MDRHIINSLDALECSDLEKKVFIANFNLGPATIPQIAKSAKVKRSTAYIAIENLVDKGLMIEDYKSYRKQVIVIEPKELIRKVAAKQRRYGRIVLQLQENLFELQAMHQATTTRPRVRTFQGFDGLISVWKDILSAKSDLLLWTNQQTEQKVFTKKHHDEFVRERCRKNLHIRVLAANNDEGRLLQLSDKQNLRDTRLIEKNIDFSTETYIYDDKIAMLDHNKAVIGIIIQSDQLADAQRAMFELSWQNSKHTS